MTPTQRQSSADAFRERAEQCRDRAKRLCGKFYRRGQGFSGCAWECGPGWYPELANMSFEMEALNERLYGECRVFVHADQIKEKFGTLRCYYSVYRDPPAPAMLLKRALMFLPDKLGWKVDFRWKRDEVEPGEEYSSVEVVDRGEYERLIAKPSPAFKAFESMGVCFRSTKVMKPPVYSKAFPTRFRPLCWTLGFLRRAALKIRAGGSDRAELMTEYADLMAEEIVAKYEKRCFSCCEECGAQIGTDFSPRCQTLGWIKYVCENCAKRHGWKYSKEKADGGEAEA